MIQWHHLLGLTLKDFFTDSSCEVDVEKDLSLKKQLLDIVIIEKKEGSLPAVLPDGLENLAKHNLLTYKSHQESLDAWTLDELIGHYVNYRKQIAVPLLPVEDFRLFAISTRFPMKLSEQVCLSPVREGIYEIRWGMKPIKVIVSSRVPKRENNAVWLMFSADPDKVQFGREHYQGHFEEMSTVMNQLFMKYNIEGVSMPYTFEDLKKDVKQEVLNSITIDEMLKKFSPDDIAKRLSPHERIKGLSPEEILSEFKPEEIEAYLKELKNRTYRQ